MKFIVTGLIMTGDPDLFETLRYRLMTNAFPHGAKVRARDLAAEFDCAASTVREALFRLSTLGLVTFQEQRGFRVPERSNTLIAELTHLRVLLEAEGAALSVRHGGVAWEAQLTAAHHQLSHLETRLNDIADKSPLVDLWFAAEQHFHQTLIARCGSEPLKDTHYRVYCQFRQQLMVEDLKFDFISTNIQHHQEILDAALAGDEDLIREKVHAHLARHMHHDAGMPLAS